MVARKKKEIGASAKPSDDPWRGNRIRDLMKSRGYGVYGGITRLQREVGVKERKTIYRWMDGEEMLFAGLQRLAEVLGTSWEYILNGAPADAEVAIEDLTLAEMEADESRDEDERRSHGGRG
jgi:transcriptional regulator with XRE-family HTH domain